jgi:ribosomal protein L34E
MSVSGAVTDISSGRPASRRRPGFGVEVHPAGASRQGRGSSEPPAPDPGNLPATAVDPSSGGRAERTELEVAAAVIVQLVEGGVMSSRPEMIARAAHVLGVPLAAIGAAVRDRRVHGYRPPLWGHPAAQPGQNVTAPPTTRVSSSADSLSDVDGGVPVPTVESQRPCNRASFIAKNPERGMRLCSRCGPSAGPKPIDQFRVKNKKTGNRMAWCIDCGKDLAAERYVAASEAGIVNFARAHLQPGSPFIGELCPACDRRLEAGDQVEGADVVLRHVRCPPATLAPSVGGSPPGPPGYGGPVSPFD